MFLFGFAKNEWENIGEEELKALRIAAKGILRATEQEIAQLLQEGKWREGGR